MKERVTFITQESDKFPYSQSDMYLAKSVWVFGQIM